MERKLYLLSPLQAEFYENESDRMYPDDVMDGRALAVYGADCSGCMTEQIYEQALHTSMDFPKRNQLRKECACLLGADIGAYNTCLHLCRYCYANYDEKSVRLNRINHNPKSAFLIGDDMPNDKVHKAVQKSWINGQISLNGFFI